MVLKILAYLLVAAGVMGLAFFRKYRGTDIPYPTLWFFISMLIAIAGIALIVKIKIAEDKKRNTYRRED